MSKYLKVMFGKTSGAGDFDYKIDEINIADNWNPNADNPKDMGGFNFSTETKILRWLIRGDTLYDVTIPDDAEVIECFSKAAPHGVFRSDKIILSNPRKVTDDIAMYLYMISDLPEESYYASLIGCAIRGYEKTTKKILKDKINKDNKTKALEEIKKFLDRGKLEGHSFDNKELVDYVINEINKN